MGMPSSGCQAGQSCCQVLASGGAIGGNSRSGVHCTRGVWLMARELMRSCQVCSVSGASPCKSCRPRCCWCLVVVGALCKPACNAASATRAWCGLWWLARAYALLQAIVGIVGPHHCSCAASTWHVIEECDDDCLVGELPLQDVLASGAHGCCLAVPQSLLAARPAGLQPTHQSW
jgi:hypothetical protein